MLKKHVSPDAKTSEFAVCQSLSKILGVRSASPDSTVMDLCSTYTADAEPSGFYDIIASVVGLYSWAADVAGEVMGAKLGPLMEFLLSRPGSVYMIKDRVRSGSDSIWVVVAEPTGRFMRALQKTPCRGLYQTVRVGDDVVMVVAVQLAACNEK